MEKKNNKAENNKAVWEQMGWKAVDERPRKQYISKWKGLLQSFLDCDATVIAKTCDDAKTAHNLCAAIRSVIKTHKLPVRIGYVGTTVYIEKIK